MRQLKALLAFLSHFIFLGVILYFWLPIARHYYYANPPLGADFLQYPTFVAYIRDHLQIPPMSWKYIWFSGNPLIIDYAWLHFYLTLPFTIFLPAVKASLMYINLSIFAYFFFSYLLFYQLSKSRFVSMALAISLVSSISTYKTLFDGGVATSVASKMFLPLVLFLLLKYFQNKNGRYLLLAGLVAGLSSLAHVGAYMVFVLAPALIFLLFYKDNQTRLVDFSKIKQAFILVITSLFVGAPTFYPMVQFLFERPGAGGLGEIKTYEGAFAGILEFTNPMLFALFAILMILVIIFRRAKNAPQIISFFALTAYLLFSWFLLLIGRHPLGQAMGPDRLYFALSLFLASGIAVFWHALFPFPQEGWRTKKILLPLLSLGIFIPLFFSFNIPALSLFGAGFQEKLVDISSKNGYPSNVFPYVTNDQKEEVDKIINPSWLDAKDTNYRHYMLEGGIETWWNTIFPLPQVRGYASPLKSKANDWLYWLDNTLLGEYIWHFNIPEAITKQHALFLIDWNAMRYIESENLPIPDYIKADPAVVETETVANNTSEPIHLLKLNDNVTSPIIRATNAPAVLLVGNVVAYDTFLKLLATENLNSRVVIPIQGPEYIEDLSSWNLADFSAVFLYNYKYHNEKDFRTRPAKPWKKLEEYVKNGGKLIIETGGEVIETDSSVLADRSLDKLPEVFPVDVTRRDVPGEAWDFTIGQDPINEGIEFSNFSPPVYEGVPWKLSSGQNIRPWAKILLAQKGQPIIAAGSLGSGKVIWSGLNLPYHFVYYLNQSEDKLFTNILGSMVNLEREENMNIAKVNRSSPEKITVSGNGFSGVLLKETFDDGWQGRLVTPKDKDLKVYKAGLYFIYIRVPSSQGQIVATLNYRGSMTAWVTFILSLGTIIFIILSCIIKMPSLKLPFMANHEKNLKSWWGKEEE